MPAQRKDNLARCIDCGRIIPPDAAQKRCAECRGEIETAQEELPAFAHLSTETACARCKLRSRLKDSEFCLVCQVEVIAELGDTTQALADRIETREESPMARLGTNELYRSKRRSTPTNRINVIGGKPLKGQLPR